MDRDGPGIGLVLVSHSRALAEAAERLVRQMAGERLPIALAAGVGEAGAGEDLGTDPTAILAACEGLADCAGIVVLMDIGSAVLSAEMARDLADDGLRARIHLSPAPFIEGALAAGVAAAAGLPAERVLAEARNGLAQKQSGLGAEPDAAPPTAPGADVSRMVTVADPAGLHLRPAARCVEVAARFDAAVRLRNGARVAGADSLTGLMALGVHGGDAVTVEATGPDAAQAVAAVAAVLAEVPATAQTPPAEASGGRNIPVSPGRAAGPLVAVHRVRPAIPDGPAEDREAALSRLDAAIAAAKAALAGDSILLAQAALLGDPAILGPARAAIRDEGRNEAAAWQHAVSTAADGYARLDDPYLRARAADVREAGDAVLRALLGGGGMAWPDAPSVILVDELTAAEAAGLPASVLGVLDCRGGPTSHAAILLRAAGIPALANVPLDPAPAAVAFDGATGEVIADPDAATAARFAPTAAATDTRPTLPLADGGTLELWANVAGPADAAAAARAGAFGIGLARTEILFLDRADTPGEAEQQARIAAMLAPFLGRPVVVRLLDAGADKPVPFLSFGREENPALGVRGIRALLRNRDFLAVHLRAILRAGEGHDMRIMVPMVTLPEEMVQTRAILTGVAAELTRPAPPLGAMVEVPAMALRIADFAAVCDFFSIGTNDLTQYAMAAERGHRELAHLADAGHPAVIALCAEVVRQAATRAVSVCGEAAGDPRVARLLVACGIRRLSMGAARLAAVRAAFAGG